MERRGIAQEYYILAVTDIGCMPAMHREESNAALVAAGFMDLLMNEMVSMDGKTIKVERELPGCDVFVSAAAVADWRPEVCSPTKLKKAAMAGVLRLVPNPDILKTILPLKGSRRFVGFAAETGEPTAEAARKLREKGLDLIVANDVTAPGAGFAVETNRVTFLFPDGRREALPLLSKHKVAERLINSLPRL